MPSGKEPFENAPDLKSAFENAHEGKRPDAGQPAPDQDKSTAAQPRPQLRPTGPMRGMANEVDLRIQREDQARKAAERKAGDTGDAPGQEDRKPRRVTQLARAFNREKDKGREP